MACSCSLSQVGMQDPLSVLEALGVGELVLSSVPLVAMSLEAGGAWERPCWWEPGAWGRSVTHGRGVGLEKQGKGAVGAAATQVWLQPGIAANSGTSEWM